MEYDKRINDNFLRADYVDGEVLQHTDLNELENVVKTAVNANYEDIQKIQDGTLNSGNAEKLSGATLSNLATETLQNSDVKIPTSAQTKNYVDSQISAIDLSGYASIVYVDGEIDTVEGAISDLDEAKVDKTELETTLEDYVTFDDYATEQKSGVIKTNHYEGTAINNGFLRGIKETYSDYKNNMRDTALISRGTLKNVIEGEIEDGNLIGNTSYATDTEGGVIKVDDLYGIQLLSNGKLHAKGYNYTQYPDVHNYSFISKYTLEKVITGKQLVNKTYADTKYEKPNDGIPKTDLSEEVQTSLGKADTSIQSSDLANYYTITQTDNLLDEKADINDIPDVSNFITKDVNNLTNYYTKIYIDYLVGDIGTALDLINGEVI